MFKSELLLLGILHILAISAQYRIQILAPGDPSCKFDYNSEYSVLHCSDYAYIQSTENRKTEIPLGKNANRFSTFLSPGAFFLFRDNEIIQYRDIFNDNQQKYQNSFPLEVDKIDFRAGILIKDGLLFYKHYEQCTVSLIPLEEGLFSVFRNKFERLSSVVLDYSQQLGDCRLNFTATLVDEHVLHMFIFIQDTHYLANITIQNQKVVQIANEHIIQPELFLDTFNWFMLKAHQNFLVLLTSNHKSRLCV